MSELNNLTLPTQYLPANWKEEAAAHFGLAPDTIRKVAKGHRKNDEVFDYLLAMAEKGKRKEERRLKKAEELNAATQPENL